MNTNYNCLHINKTDWETLSAGKKTRNTNRLKRKENKCKNKSIHQLDLLLSSFLMICHNLVCISLKIERLPTYASILYDIQNLFLFQLLDRFALNDSGDGEWEVRIDNGRRNKNGDPSNSYFTCEEDPGPLMSECHLT